MKNDRLQLMVHGRNVADSTPELRYAGVRIEHVTHLANKNYLFIDLRIATAAKPGNVPITFRRGNNTQTIQYPLKMRTPGSAQRKGFSNADVILNLMPDRFANGNLANDDQPGFEDKANRGDDSAGRHGGDIQGIIDHLDYIAAMGYTAIWPTPLTENNQPKYSYHGYATTDTYRIDPRFGSNEDYRRLVQVARSKGIGVIQDMVPNHIGSNHWWMKDLPSPDWINHAGQFAPTNHARSAVSDPYAAPADALGFNTGWFDTSMPDPNQRNSLLATYQIQNTLWWIEYAGLSGLRIDTYGYSDKIFLANYSRRVMEEYPNLNMVGEEWSGNPVLVSYWLRGRRQSDGYLSSMPSMMDFPLHEALRRALIEPDSLHSGFTTLYEALVNDRLYPEPANMVLFEGNHDVSRLFSAVNEDQALWRMGLVYVLTMPRIPQLYYGTELQMTSPKQRDDGAIRRDFPGGWPGDRVNAFTGAGLSDTQRDAQSFVRTLLNWRKTQPVVHHGKLRHYVPEDGTYVYFRYDASNTVMIAFNKNVMPRTLDSNRFREFLDKDASGTDILTGKPVNLGENVSLPARSVMVIQLDHHG